LEELLFAAKNGQTILLGEDDIEVRGYIETALKCQGYSVELAQDGDEVLSALQGSPAPISAVILNVVLPRKNGIQVLREIRRFDGVTPVIMVAGTASPLEVVEAMKDGANDFMVKPVTPEDLRRSLRAAFGNKPPAAPRCVEPQAAPPDREVFFGTNPEMRELQKLIGPIGWSDAPVLILGETGVGKEVLAREVHARSPRAKKSILKLNCAALPSELVESELFGYERGAFTGAFQKKLGMFELANGATILLDEIGDMDFRLQAKLLQVLQDQEFQRLGGKDTIRVDVRVIASTHRDLGKAMAENAFREDLYYRLNVMNIRVPALRERREDIVSMAEFLLRKRAAPGAPPVQIPPPLAEVFREYHWPGNVRELENTVRRFLILRDAESLEREFRAKLSRPSVNGTTAPVAAREEAPASPKAPVIAVIPDLSNVPDPSIPVLEQIAKVKREAERIAILEALKTTHWNRRQAAVLVHVDYKALLYKMKVLSIKKEKPGGTPLRPEIASVPVLADPIGASAERYSFARARIGSRPPATNAPHSEGEAVMLHGQLVMAP
jgi:two-component system, NtrC family, response regulator AtoC